MEMMWSGAQPERTSRRCVTSNGLLPVGDKSRTHKRGTTPMLPRQTWPVTKTPSAQAEPPKTLQDAELEKLASHCGPNRRHNLNADAGTRKATRPPRSRKRTPAEGEVRQLVADVGPPSRKTFNRVLRPSHVRRARKDSSHGSRPAHHVQGGQERTDQASSFWRSSREKW